MIDMFVALSDIFLEVKVKQWYYLRLFLKGTLSRVTLYASAYDEPITKKIAIEALKNIFIEEEN